jgi:hypothetical protein
MPAEAASSGNKKKRKPGSEPNPVKLRQTFKPKKKKSSEIKSHWLCHKPPVKLQIQYHDKLVN